MTPCLEQSTRLELARTGLKAPVLDHFEFDCIVWRKARGSNPYDRQVITVFKTDKHANFAAFQLFLRHRFSDLRLERILLRLERILDCFFLEGDCEPHELICL